MKLSKLNLKKISVSALFCAIICIISQFSVMTPFGIPLTLQTFAISLCGYTLGAYYGTASVFIYIIIGVFGLPVFSAFQGGAQVLFGPTGGFIWGFILLCFFCGIAKSSDKLILKILFSSLGLVFCHLIGIFQFKIISGNSFIAAFLLSCLPYLLKDIISLVLAFYLSVQIKKRIKGLF